MTVCGVGRWNAVVLTNLAATSVFLLAFSASFCCLLRAFFEGTAAAPLHHVRQQRVLWAADRT